MYGFRVVRIGCQGRCVSWLVFKGLLQNRSFNNHNWTSALKVFLISINFPCASLRFIYIVVSSIYGKILSKLNCKNNFIFFENFWLYSFSRRVANSYVKCTPYFRQKQNFCKCLDFGRDISTQNLLRELPQTSRSLQET